MSETSMSMWSSFASHSRKEEEVGVNEDSLSLELTWSLLLKLLLVVFVVMSIILFCSVLSGEETTVDLLKGEQLVFNVSRAIDLSFVEIVSSSSVSVYYSNLPYNYDIKHHTTTGGHVISSTLSVQFRSHSRVKYFWQSNTCEFNTPLILQLDLSPPIDVNCRGEALTDPDTRHSTEFFSLISFSSPRNSTLKLINNSPKEPVTVEVQAEVTSPYYFFTEGEYYEEAKGTNLRIPFEGNSQEQPPLLYVVVTASSAAKVRVRAVASMSGGVQAVLNGFSKFFVDLCAFALKSSGLSPPVLSGCFLLLLLLCRLLIYSCTTQVHPYPGDVENQVGQSAADQSLK
eukprot:TRINITY_DN8808_c0_g1_i1.p1 TRINITY_DN8808_c0_g1~~TRINITY_DN8808_c0_g1_i1.p1  ORF type:complete len:343 (-),score=26.25 TRINITY_DN8808_c0_g1_i1:37-1065(-)